MESNKEEYNFDVIIMELYIITSNNGEREFFFFFFFREICMGDNNDGVLSTI